MRRSGILAICAALVLMLNTIPLISSPTSEDNSNSEIPQISNRSRIVVYETYYFYYDGILVNDPFALGKEELRERSFGFVKEGSVFYYLNNERDIEILIEYFPNLDKINVYSRRFYVDQNEITEGEILENFDGYVADLREEAIQGFEGILVEGNPAWGVSRTRTPLKFLCIKDVQFRELQKREFGQVGIFEVKNETGQLIAWSERYDSSEYSSVFSRMIYLVSNYPETEIRGGFEPNNSIMRLYQDSLDSILDMNIDQLRSEYYDAIITYHKLRREYYYTVLNDRVSTITIMPLLCLRRNITIEMLKANRILDEINKPFDSTRDYWKTTVANEIYKLDFEGDSEEFKNLLTSSIDEAYNETKEDCEALQRYLPEFMEELEKMGAINESINGLIFSFGGILAFLAILVYVIKFFYEDQFGKVNNWMKNNSLPPFLVKLITLWIIIHDSLKIIYFQYGISNQRLAWIGKMTELHSCYISIISLFYACFFFSVMRNGKNVSWKTLVAGFTVTILLIFSLIIRSDFFLYFLLLFVLAVLFLMNFYFKNEKGKSQKKGKISRRARKK